MVVEARDAAAAHTFAERSHVCERGAHVGHDVAAVDHHRPARSIAQRDMQDGSVLGDVDVLTGKHPIAEPFDVTFPRQLSEEA